MRKGWRKAATFVGSTSVPAVGSFRASAGLPRITQPAVAFALSPQAHREPAGYTSGKDFERLVLHPNNSKLDSLLLTPPWAFGIVTWTGRPRGSSFRSPTDPKNLNWGGACPSSEGSAVWGRAAETPG